MGLNVPTSLEAWRSALQALLPPGRALTREPGSTLAKLLEAFAAMFKGTQDTLDALALEADPRQAGAYSMLPEWERLLGLPDACTQPVKQLLVPGVYPEGTYELVSFTRAGGATCFDENGQMITQPANVPRIEHDVTQLIGEAPSVNLLLWSGDFDQPVWTPFNSVPEPGATPPPGGTKAFKLKENTAAGVTHYVVQSAGSFLAGEPFVYSAKLKAAERYLVQFRTMISGAMTANRFAELDLSNGTNTTPGGLVGAGTLKMVPLGGGWYRVSIAATADANGTVSCAVFLEAPGFGNTYAGDGVSGLYLADAQLEPGLTMTSYIRTMAAIAYRVARYASSGLLIEATATNNFIYSDRLDNNAAWSDIGLPTVTANTTVAPDGTFAADTFTDSSAVAFQGRGRVFAVPNDNSSWCCSLYLKKTVGGTAPTFAVNYRLVNGVALSTQVRINTDTGGVLSTGSAVTLTVKLAVAFGVEYWRVGVGITNNSSGNTQLLFDLYPAASAYGGGLIDSVAATGSAVVWRTQCEPGLIPSSGIQTTAVAATRAADIAYIDVPQTLLERRAQAFARLTEQGGQSRQYFIDLAAALGEPGCTITEYRPMNCNSDCNDALYSQADIFSWRMNIPHSNAGARPMNCNDDCNDPLDLGGASPIECPIRERAPAHTSVLFAYSA